jgi:CBS-domain-containing membrane protein
VATDTLRAGASNAEALQVMTDKDLEAVVLVDDSARLSGVVERERVVADMLLAATP